MAFVAHGVRIVERKGRERKSLDIRSSYAKETSLFRYILREYENEIKSSRENS